MSARKRGMDDASQHEAISIDVDPRYAARYRVDATPSRPGQDQPARNPKASPDPGDQAEPVNGWARVEAVLARWGAYWGRAGLLAVRTVFPTGTVAEIRAWFSRKDQTR